MVFGWFKKKKTPELSPDMQAFAKKMFGPQALAVSIAEMVREYVDEVKAGRIEYPAHRRKSPSVLAVWADGRLEAAHKMFNFGQSDVMMLADFRKQAELLDAFVNEQPHLEFPQPRGEPVADTLQSVWQAYMYLDAVGSEVMDRTTDRATLKASGSDVITDFTTKATKLRDLWADYDRAMKASSRPLPEMPETMLEVRWADLTAKTKSIAMSKIFGPSYEGGMQYVLNSLAKNASESEVKSIKAGFERLRAAVEPEDI
jgi:hypothetical protein